MNDTSVTKFERSRLINKIFGNSIKTHLKFQTMNLMKIMMSVYSIASHNGYERDFGCIYKRTIYLNKSTGDISGSDELIKNKENKLLNYSLRFHFNSWIRCNQNYEWK